MLPPPPPPDVDEDLLESDSEALYSMLIAWYMSGYHTGYYQVGNDKYYFSYFLCSCIQNL